MKQFRFIGILLQPSLGSVMGIFGLSLVIFFLSTLSVTRPSGLIYDFLFGPESRDAPEFINLARDSLMTLSNTVFGNETLNKVLFFICWLLLGTVVYLISSSISNSVVAANDIRSELHYMNLHKEELEREVGKRLALRGVAILNWFFYGLFFFKFLLPYSVSAAHIAVSLLGSWQGWAYGLLSLLVLMVSLHIHLVLLRFTLLRPRVFGGWETAVQEEKY